MKEFFVYRLRLGKALTIVSVTGLGSKSSSLMISTSDPLSSMISPCNLTRLNRDLERELVFFILWRLNPPNVVTIELNVDEIIGVDF
jgi:hypothetical protein